MRGGIFVFSLGNERNGLGKEQNSKSNRLTEIFSLHWVLAQNFNIGPRWAFFILNMDVFQKTTSYPTLLASCAPHKF